MAERWLNILKNTPSVDGWLAQDRTVESCELFFIGKKLDMNRRKDVRYTDITVYRDMEEGGVRYKGSASVKLSPAMTDAEIAEKITEAAQAAASVKNPAYELAAPSGEKLKTVQSAFSAEGLAAYLPKLSAALYGEDHFDKGRINSSEFFLEKVDVRVLNSRGVDESFTVYRGQIEMVVEWKETGEEVELFDILNFSDFRPERIREAASEALAHARMRAIAAPLPAIKGVPVILRRENVGKFFDFYVEQTDASLIYQKYSSAKAGSGIQGDTVEGDKINLTLLPELDNSVASRYIDGDGVKLRETPVIRDGVLTAIHGSNRFSQYLGVAPTGMIGNVRVEGGSRSLAELKKDPYLEIFYFSDFQMDDITGDFGGEVRLGVYFDGEKEIPVTGGSINGNVRNVQGRMQLSREMQTIDNYCCPQAVKLFDVSISS